MNTFDNRNANDIALEEDEKKQRTEYLRIDELPEEKQPSEYKRYMQKQIYFSMLRLGGDWNK